MSEGVLAIIQARMGSARLPGKVLMPVMGRPLISYLIERVRRSTLISSLVVATTDSPIDIPLVEVVQREGVAVFRGDEHDVLKRFADCSDQRTETRIVRITADCPLLDPAIIDKCVALARNLPQNGLVTSSPHRAEDREFPRGMDVEVFSKIALNEACRYGNTSYEREHVTPYFRNNPDKYPLHLLPLGKNYSHYRLTVDEMRDFEVVSTVLAGLYPIKQNFVFRDIVDFLESRPEIGAINAPVHQRV
jgi:spore coat polysaccharide biosynthesis protein SpsF